MIATKIGACYEMDINRTGQWLLVHKIYNFDMLEYKQILGCLIG